MKFRIAETGLLIIVALVIATNGYASLREKVTLRIISAVLDENNLTIKYEIKNRSSAYMELVIPDRISVRARLRSGHLPFRTLARTKTKLLLFSDVAHCAGDQEPPHKGVPVGVKQLQHGTQTGKIVLLRPIREYFPFHKKGRVYDGATWGASEMYINLDRLKYLQLENNWVNFVDYSKTMPWNEYGYAIDMDKVKSVKLTIAIFRDYGLRLVKGRILDVYYLCGQGMKTLVRISTRFMFYITAEKELTRSN